MEILEDCKLAFFDAFIESGLILSLWWEVGMKDLAILLFLEGTELRLLILAL